MNQYCLAVNVHSVVGCFGCVRKGRWKGKRGEGALDGWGKILNFLCEKHDAH